MSWVEVLIVIAIIGLFMFTLLAGGIGGMSHLSFPADVAQIEALRRDAAKANVAESEDIMGQVTEVNQKIARARAWNQIPLACLLVPNGWDTVEPIEVRP